MKQGRSPGRSRIPLENTFLDKDIVFWAQASHKGEGTGRMLSVCDVILLVSGRSKIPLENTFLDKDLVFWAEGSQPQIFLHTIPDDALNLNIRTNNTE